MPLKSVKYTQDLGYEGQIITDNYGSIRGALRPFYNKTGAVLPFGRVGVLTTGSKTDIQLPSGSGTTPKGIIIFNDFLSGVPLETPDIQGYQNYALISLLVGGAIDVVVYSEVATNYDDPVFYRHNVVGQTNLGQFSNVTGTDFTSYPGARFVYKTSGAGLSVINISGL